MVFMLIIRLILVGRITALIVWTRKGQRQTPVAGSAPQAGPVTSIIIADFPAVRKLFERHPDLHRPCNFSWFAGVISFRPQG